MVVIKQAEQEFSLTMPIDVEIGTVVPTVVQINDRQLHGITRVTIDIPADGVGRLTIEGNVMRDEGALGLVFRPGGSLVTYRREFVGSLKITGAIAEIYLESESSQPPAICSHCRSFYGQAHNDNLLVCAIHPYGNGENCLDFEARNAESDEIHS